jgi:hypothetical protein
MCYAERVRCGAYLLWAGFLLLIAGTSEPQPYQNSSQTSGQQTFRSPDGTFRFTYPSSYKLYTGSETDQAPGIIPVCQSAVACVVYPRSTYAGTNFGAAAFQAREIDDATTENVCLRPPILAANGPRFNTAPKDPTKNINGVSFLHGIDSSAAAGSYINSDLYRTFYRSKCYELSINITATRFENFPQGGVREFSSGDEQRVENELTMILNSFRFLK